MEGALQIKLFCLFLSFVDHLDKREILLITIATVLSVIILICLLRWIIQRKKGKHLPTSRIYYSRAKHMFLRCQMPYPSETYPIRCKVIINFSILVTTICVLSLGQ